MTAMKHPRIEDAGTGYPSHSSEVDVTMRTDSYGWDKTAIDSGQSATAIQQLGGINQVIPNVGTSDWSFQSSVSMGSTEGMWTGSGYPTGGAFAGNDLHGPCLSTMTWQLTATFVDGKRCRSLANHLQRRCDPLKTLPQSCRL